MSPETFVCFLRGINVSGKNLIKMNELTDLFLSSGFVDVTTYLQSGNVIFRSALLTKEPEISREIEKAIMNRFDFNVPVLVKSAIYILELNGRNPFLKNSSYNIDKLHITMLDSEPESKGAAFLAANNYSPEEFQISDCDVFLFCPEGYGRAKLNNNYLEKKLGVTATTRNWKTITNIRDIIINQYTG